MDDMKYELLIEVNSRLEADLLESYLEAHEIDVELFQEAVGHNVYPVSVDGLGRVQIFVPRENLEEARMLINTYLASGTP